MKELIDQFVEMERAISDDKGDFWLFALFLREDAQDRWDLVVSAPWIESDPKTALQYLAKRVQERFEPSEAEMLSRIVLVDQANPALGAVNRAIRVEHGAAEVQDSNFFGLSIQHAFIITSRGPEVSAATSP